MSNQVIAFHTLLSTLFCFFFFELQLLFLYVKFLASKSIEIYVHLLLPYSFHFVHLLNLCLFQCKYRIHFFNYFSRQLWPSTRIQEVSVLPLPVFGHKTWNVFVGPDSCEPARTETTYLSLVRQRIDQTRMKTFFPSAIFSNERLSSTLK